MTKLFISHASEDKDEFVRPLAERLREDFEVWYDEYELVMGDKLLEKIDHGLRSCDYGVVVLSKHFFSKQWPQEELNGLFALETEERKVILPVWKGVTREDVKKASPILAGRLAASVDLGLDGVVHEIKKAVGLVDRVKGFDSAWRDKFAALDSDITHHRAAGARSWSREGVQQVTESARKIIAEGKSHVEALMRDMPSLEFSFAGGMYKPSGNLIQIHGPQGLSLHVEFHSEASNCVDGSGLYVNIFRRESLFPGRPPAGKLEDYYLIPKFDRELEVYWEDEDKKKILRNEKAVLDFVFSRFAEILRNETKEANRL